MLPHYAVHRASSDAAFYPLSNQTRTNMKNTFRTLALLLALTLPQSAAIAETAIKDMMADRPMGQESAPVTVIEYASMTCPHCASFNNDILPIVKKELIDTGKMKYVFRDFPLDRYAVKAAMLSRCAPADKYHEIVDAIYKQQKDWTRETNPIEGLTKIGRAAGMDEGTIGMCMGMADLEDAILAGMQSAQRDYKISSTPTFLYMQNGKMLDQFPAFTALVEKNSKHAHDEGHNHGH
jgi:protein-disulfide isomerase